MSEKPEDAFELDLGRYRTISVAEAAEMFGVAESWYLAKLRAQVLPGHKIGRNWRLTEDDLKQALELTASHAINYPRPDPTGLRPRSRRHLMRRGR